MKANLLAINTYNTQNMGEVAHLRALRQGLPDCDITLASLYSIIDGELCGDLGIAVAGNTRSPTRLGAALRIPRMAAEAAAYSVLGRMPKSDIMRAYADCDLVVDLGGDTFSDDPSPMYTLAHSVCLILAVMMGKPYVVCSQTIGPFRTWATKRLARALLKRAETITARGRVTRDYLTVVLGIDKVIETADLAFLLRPPKAKRSEYPTVGINPGSQIDRWMGKSPGSFTYEVMMAGVATSLNKGRKVMLIPHAIGPQKGVGAVRNLDDRVGIRKIKEIVPSAMILDKGANHHTISESIAGCDLLVTGRMHGAVEAAMAGIPVAYLYYSNKGDDLIGHLDGGMVEAVDVRGKELWELHRDIMCAVKKLESGGKRVDTERLGAMAARNITAIEDALDRSKGRLLGSHISWHIGRATDPAVREKAASGGIATALLCHAVKSGMASDAVICPVTRSGCPPWFRVTSDEGEIRGAAGSVYTLTRPSGFAERSPTGRLVMTGLPCRTRAMRRKGNLTVGLFCSHAVELRGVQFLLSAMGVGQVEELTYRAKRKGTTGLLVRGDGTEQFVPLRRYWNRLFNFAFIPRGCWRCKDLTNEEADISVGDAWRVSPGDNAIVVRTEEGRRLLEGAVAAGTVEVRDASPSEIAKGQRMFLKVKKRPGSLFSAAYRVARALGHFVSDRECLHPLLGLWIRAAVVERR